MILYIRQKIFCGDAEMENKNENKKFRITDYVPVWSMVLFAIAICALTVELIAKSNVAFAEAINESAGRVIRLILAKSTSFIPFSLAETFLLCSPVLIAILVMLVIRAGNKSLKSLIKFTAGILSLITLIYSTFVFGFGAGYYGKTIDEKLGLDRKDVSAQELYDTARLLLSGAEKELENVTFPEGTYSSMMFSYAEMNEKLNRAWEKVSEKYPCFQSFRSNTKPVMLSGIWTYTHTSGVYSFFTGEANVNVNYPDFIIISSAAHEMAHQRGVAREDEANFASFLVCINSDDPYIRYSGYLDMFREVRDKLYSADKELYNKLVSAMSAETKKEIYSFAKFFDKYRDNVAATVSNKVNDTYITSHGQEAGIKSYGLVVDLLCAYMLYGDGATK